MNATPDPPSLPNPSGAHPRAPTEDDPQPTAKAPPASRAADTTSGDPDALREGPGTRIGPYKLLQQIGEGGFGAVFMAEQEQPVRRLVALKIIKLGMDTRQVVARFEQERQALAMMDHPNIARVIDAGTTATGRPYFVMDLVKGDPIAEYCDKNNLPIEERLDLFAQVCTAVQHAHTKGIIHRDLKPSNILVSTQDGRPTCKVIDFGIAKATSQKLTDKTLFTEHHQVIGTVQYMSPEQAEGSLDIDTRADVYALGVVLYELLTGSTPFDAKTLREAFYSEVQRMIREDEPPRPSTRLHQSSDTLASVAAHRRVEPKRLGAIVRGELDWIVMKALEKDRARRYDTASGLALDVRRYLEGEAVVAAPPSATYRFQKFVRRHRVTVTAGAAVAAALLVGVVAFAWQARVAQRQRDAAISAREAEAAARQTAQLLGESEAKQRAIAETNERKAAAINKFLLDMLGTADIRDLGRDAKVSQALDRAAASVGTAFQDRPEVEAAVRGILGKTYVSIGMLDAGEPQIEAALALNRQLYGDASIELAHSLIDLGFLELGRGEIASSVEHTRQAVEIATKKNGPDDAFTLGAQSDYANGLVRMHREPEAEAILRDILATRTRLLGREHADNQIAMNSLAVLLHNLGRLDEAEPLYREAVEIGSRVLGPAHPDTLTARINLASLLRSRRKFAECEPMMVAAVADTRRVFGDSHAKTAGAEWALAGLYRDQGRIKDALPLLEDCLAIRRRDEGERSVAVAEAKSTLAAVLKSLGEVDRAVSFQRQVVATYVEVFGAEGERTLSSRLNLANMLPPTVGAAEAEAMLRELLETCPRVLGDDHKLTIIATNSYGVFLMGEERYADAEPYVQKALEIGRRVEGEDSESTIITECNLAYVECELGRLAEAERLSLDVIERFTRVLGPRHPSLANARGDHGRILTRLGRQDEARAEFAAAIAISKAALGEKNSRFCKDALELGRLLIEAGRADEAEPMLREVVDAYAEVRGPKDVRTANARIELGRCCQRLGRFDDAEKLFVDARDALVAARPAGHSDIEKAERALVEFYASRK